MTQMTLSNSTLNVLPPSILLECIRMIQTRCPGWWWSISQKTVVNDAGTQTSLCFNMGPGRNCPHVKDIDYALTEEGDKGKSTTIVFGKVNRDRKDHPVLDSFVRSFLQDLLWSFDEPRGFYKNLRHPAPDFIPGKDVTYRYQHQSDLIHLEEAYTKLIEEELPLFSSKNYTVNEVYLGSCDLSADCSLRGIRDNREEFDISVDYQEDAIIADSLNDAVIELKNDILTPR